MRLEKKSMTKIKFSVFAVFMALAICFGASIGVAKATAPTYETKNVATGSQYWNVADSDFSVSATKGLGFTGSTGSILLKNKIAANTTTTIKIHSSYKDAPSDLYNHQFFVFKNMDADPKADAYNYEKDNYASTFMYIKIGDGKKAELHAYHAVEGVYTDVKLAEKIVDMAGFMWNSEYATQWSPNWNFVKFDIKVDDTETGIKVSVITNNADLNNKELFKDVVVNDVAFLGESAMSLGFWGNKPFPAEKFYFEEITSSISSNKNPEVKAAKTIDYDASTHLNLVTSSDYWKSGLNPATFQFTSNYGMYYTEVNEAAMLLYNKVPTNSIFRLDVVGNIPAAGWGDMYIVFKNKNAKPIANQAKAAPEGDWLALQLSAGDGLNMMECTNGVVKKTKYEAADNTDIWHFYKQTSQITIQTEDTLEGVDVYFNILGASTKLTKILYQSTNTALHGDYAMSVHYWTGGVGSDDNTITTNALSFSSIDSFIAPSIDVAALTSSLNAITAITPENRASSVALVADAKEKYENMNYTMLKTFSYLKITELEDKIKQYDLDFAAANTIIAAINELPTQITSANIVSTIASIAEIKTNYDALSAGAKTLVTNYATIAELENKIDAYNANQVVIMIAALPTSITKDTFAQTKTAATAAKTAYDALSADEKKLVTNLSILTALEQKITLHETSVAAISAVINKIEALETNVTADNVAAVTDAAMQARSAYDALSANEKTQITNYEKLTTLEKSIKNYAENKDDKKGCNSLLVGGFNITIIILGTMLVFALFMFRKKARK